MSPWACGYKTTSFGSLQHCKEQPKSLSRQGWVPSGENLTTFGAGARRCARAGGWGALPPLQGSQTPSPSPRTGHGGDKGAAEALKPPWTCSITMLRDAGTLLGHPAQLHSVPVAQGRGAQSSAPMGARVKAPGWRCQGSPQLLARGLRLLPAHCNPLQAPPAPPEDPGEPHRQHPAPSAGEKGRAARGRGRS